MINRIKQWDFKNFKINDKSIINFSLFLSIFALVLSIPSGTPCLSANECQVGSDATFTNDVNIKSGTNYNLTLGHNYAQNVIANFEEVGGNHTGSVILKDNSGDMNLNGGLVLGTSATSTNGTIRWNGSGVQVYNSGWSDVGSPDQNVFTTINGNSGSLTASTTTTSIKLEADSATGLTVVASGDKLEIQSSGGGGSFNPNVASYNLDSSLGYASNPNGYAPNSSTIYFGYNGTSDVTTEMYDIGNCWSTSIANIPTDNVNGLLFVYDTNCGSHPYKISYKIQMYDSTQGQSQQQRSRVSTQLYYVENSTTRHSMKYGDNNIDGYNQYSQSYVSGFNNTIYDEAIVCFGYDTSESNSIYLRVRGHSRSHIKGDTAEYKFSTISMERLNLGSLNTCDNTVSPYPSMN